VGRGGRGERPAAAPDAEQGTRLEVRDGPDVWGRVGSERRRKGRGSGLAAGKWAAVKGVGPREGRWAGGERRGRLGWWAEREGRS
jgi:hypothetical protein